MNEPTDTPTPETDSAYDALDREACGIEYVRRKMKDMERARDEALRELAQAKAEVSALRTAFADASHMAGPEYVKAIALAKGLRDALKITSDNLMCDYCGDGYKCPGCKEACMPATTALDAFRAAYPDL